MKPCAYLVLACVFLFNLIGCIMPSSNVAVMPGTSLASLRTVAVWKFVDGEVRNSGDAATRALETALMRRGVRVIPFARIRDVVAVEIGFREGMSLEAGMLTPAALARIRSQSGADALLLGSVGMVLSDLKYAPSNFIEFNFQMVNTHDGTLVASGSVSDEAWSMQKAAAKAAEKFIKAFGSR